MNKETAALIESLLSDPEGLIQKTPFHRGMETDTLDFENRPFRLNDKVTASIPTVRYLSLTQKQMLAEFDPYCHKVLRDDSIPCISVKTQKGVYVPVEYSRMAIPFQHNIRDKQVLHLCQNPMTHTLLNENPTDTQNRSFVAVKQYWKLRNMEGKKTEMVKQQLCMGDAALLFYFDHAGRISARNLCYEDGYVIVTHKDDNGDHVMECLYYSDGQSEYIDCYDQENFTRFTRGGEFPDNATGWVRHASIRHGFPECPLITKRGDVAWNNVQSLIEVYEILYNVFMVIQKRHGWGMLYIKGNLDEKARRMAGSVILRDKSMSENADAKYLAPPSPQNMIETLEQMEYSIQKGSGTTFILPKDIKIGSDVSGLAIQLTQELDIETAHRGVTEWQNVAAKMMRLFKHGLSVELVNSGEIPTAITDFADIDIHSEFNVWRPQSNESYNQMITTLHGAGGLSLRTFVEKNTESAPDELSRIKAEAEAETSAENIEPQPTQAF